MRQDEPGSHHREGRRRASTRCPATAEHEVDRYLALLRQKIRERGFTQLEVQDSLRWGRSYVSQLLNKQKSLRVEQVLLILEAIGVDRGEFFGRLYPRAHDTPEPGEWHESVTCSDPGALSRAAGEGAGEKTLAELRRLVRGVADLLLDKRLLSVDELSRAVHGQERAEERRASEGSTPLVASRNHEEFHQPI